ncbi:MAG TPA: endolytic transglycosylase MltG [Alphaproteobacteria bacterium]|nr:endolytic transglycosylase MltG [Alphaproteobacteria bacterium]
MNNPSRASLTAALNPEAHEFLFFVADGTGGHKFGKNYSEHQKNVAEWRRINKAASKKN